MIPICNNKNTIPTIQTVAIILLTAASILTEFTNAYSKYDTNKSDKMQSGRLLMIQTKKNFKDFKCTKKTTLKNKVQQCSNVIKNEIARRNLQSEINHNRWNEATIQI